MKASCIIPTYGRDVSVVTRTLESLLNLNDEFFNLCANIFIVDQNSPALVFDSWLDSVKEHEIEYIVYDAEVEPNSKIYKSDKARIIHIKGLTPSLPIAKNYAAAMSDQEFLFIFDDDVVVNPGCLKSHIEALESDKNLGAIAGREIVEPQQFQRSGFRETVVSLIEKFLPAPESENRYKLNGKYVGRVKPNSLIFCRYESSGEGAVEVDTVRGCYWSIKRDVFNEAGGFDENFQGALRDETDLCLRVKKQGYKIKFLSDAFVYHKRQLGGCNNVSTSYNSVLTKYDNEFYFQYKHFLSISPLYYFFRLLPLVLETLKSTRGLSLIAHIQFTWKFFEIKTSSSRKKQYESTFKKKALL